ncbi:MAG: Uncharacterized protein CH6_3715 [Candidatus Kapaibacterium sp.]|nr:MAG: Uncharacterized protein CH6_3715 [Candidatus Kapabacteria bacterium]
MGIGITFLGTGNYQKVVYSYNNTTVETEYFPFAFCKFFNLDEIYIVLTEESKQKHFGSIEKLFQCCDNPPNLRQVSIPRGQNQDELWTIFDILSNSLPEKASIYFDITHAFRSIPFMIFAVCNFLTVVKNVKIEKVVYGAYESKINNVAPVFDLTPFLELINMSTAVNEFLRFGNSLSLKSILKKIHSESYKFNLPEKPKSLTPFADTLANLTNALSIARVEEAIRHSNKLAQKIQNFTQEITHFNQTKPFSFLLNKIQDRFSNTALNFQSIFSRDGFKVQLKLLDYYIETEQYFPAITLAREIVVSFIACRNGLNPKKRDHRAEVEQQLGKLAKDFENQQNLNKYENDLGRLWSIVSTTRNDINHAGMNENPMDTAKAINNINKVCLLVKDFISKYD